MGNSPPTRIRCAAEYPCNCPLSGTDLTLDNCRTRYPCPPNVSRMPSSTAQPWAPTSCPIQPTSKPSGCVSFFEKR